MSHWSWSSAYQMPSVHLFIHLDICVTFWHDYLNLVEQWPKMCSVMSQWRPTAKIRSAHPRVQVDIRARETFPWCSSEMSRSHERDAMKSWWTPSSKPFLFKSKRTFEENSLKFGIWKYSGDILFTNFQGSTEVETEEPSSPISMEAHCCHTRERKKDHYHVIKKMLLL